MSLANIDPRILGALRAIREGRWSYTCGFSSPPDLVSSLSTDLGYPAVWGDPSRIPSHGGSVADAAWKTLGVTNRGGLGGIPCELVHGGIGASSCTSNALLRGTKAFAEAMAIYTPVCFTSLPLQYASSKFIGTYITHPSHSSKNTHPRTSRFQNLSIGNAKCCIPF
jgi:hypothetical protein